MKRIFALPLVLALSAVLWANPVRPGQWAIITLADGTQVRAELRGDEHLDYMRGEDGTAYTRIEGTQTYQRADLAQLQARTKAARAANAQRRARRAPLFNASRQAAYTGKKKGLIILVEFKDVSFKAEHDKAFYERVANEVGFTHEEGYHGSVHDYFLAQSNGLFDLTFDVAGPYKLTKSYSYYGGNTPWKDYYVTAMVREAVDMAKNDVNWADYDWDGDNLVDQVFLLYAGDNEAYQGADANTIWPHKSSIYKRLMKDGKYVSTYACGSEMTQDFSSGIGTFCHEFTHCLGIMDMYDTDYSGSGGEAYGMGYWDVMASGGDLDMGMTPAGYTSYEKWVSGWLTPTVLTGKQDVKDMKALSEGGPAYVVYNEGRSPKSEKGEYYLLENRQKTGWDAALPGSGLLILHVDFDQTEWYGNGYNDFGNRLNVNPDHQRCTVFHARNRETESSLTEIGGDAYPYMGNDRLTNDSQPAATVFNKNTDGSFFMNYPISGITQKNGLISFAAGYEAERADLNVPDTDPTGALFYESFDQCNGTGANDYVWAASTMGAGTFTSDVDGWTASAKGGADRCAMFGSKTKNGTAITPYIEVDGEATLYFHAAPWQDENCTVTLSATNGITLSEKTLQLTPGTWTPLVTTLTGKGRTKITFKPSQRRFFLDEVIVKDGSSTGITAVKTAQTASNRIYTLSGQYVGTSFDRLPKGIYVVGGVKVVK